MLMYVQSKKGFGCGRSSWQRCGTIRSSWADWKASLESVNGFVDGTSCCGSSNFVLGGVSHLCEAQAVGEGQWWQLHSGFCAALLSSRHVASGSTITYSRFFPRCTA